MQEIESILIFEMLGRPAEHLKKAMEDFIEKISKEEGVTILNKKINEPKKIEQAKGDLFTTFSEIEIKFKDILHLFKILFGYMASHIEIVSPEELKIKSFDFNSIVNELVRKLHQYDEIAKKMLIERNILQRQLQQAGIQMPNFQAGISNQEKKDIKTKKKTTKKKNTRKNIKRKSKNSSQN